MINSYTPWQARNQIKYVTDALEKNELSFHGSYHKKFSKALADYHGVKHCVLTTSGTTALWALYHAAGLDGKRVLTGTLTYAASVNQLLMAGAEPVLVDCDDHCQLDLNQVEKALKEESFAAVVVASLYGDCCDLERLRWLCDEYGVALYEDNAEGLGCQLNGKRLGTFGRASTLSGFSNKVITFGGEGGAVLTDDDGLAAGLTLFSNHATVARFKHSSPVCSNLRMTNLQAAVGLAQLEDLDAILAAKRNLIDLFIKEGYDGLVGPRLASPSNHWLPLARGSFRLIDPVAQAAGIELRPVFWPVHRQPNWPSLPVVGSLRNSERVERELFLLPGAPGMTEDEVRHVVSTLKGVSW